MAIVFTPDSDDAIVIGGEINPSTGIPGPFPNYSISRTPIRKDSMFLGNTYEISITGTAIINSTVDMLTKGARQNAIHGLIKDILFTGGKKGQLEIDPYGGLSNTLLFSNAVLMSVDAAEQDDQSQGVQSQNYTFTFNADRLSVNGDTIDDVLDVEQDLSDITESWESGLVDGDYNQGDFEADATSQSVKRKWTISHTLSAVGMSQAGGDSGYIQAKEYVESRITALGNDPLTATDLSVVAKAIDFDIPTGLGYAAYDQVNQVSQGMLDGSYSITRTWIVSEGGSAGMQLSFEFSDDQAAEFQSISTSLTVNGYETQGPNSSFSHKYINAKTKFDSVVGSIPSWSALFYADRDSTGGALRLTPSSTSQSHDQTNGVITYSATFDDSVVLYSGAISESINISYNNEDGGNNTVAIIPVIAKSDGPVIQNMQTTNERTRSISLELLMSRDNRTSKPNGVSHIENNYNYIPAVTNPYRQNLTETWNPKSGQYSVSLDYVFNETPTN